MADNNNIPTTRIDQLFERISTLIDQSRHLVAKTVKAAEVCAKYEIGKYIVEYEQGGAARAAYGTALLKELSQRLTNNYGEGWSVETLTACRKFFNVYSKIVNSVHDIEPRQPDVATGDSWAGPKFTLSWSHYSIN